MQTPPEILLENVPEADRDAVHDLVLREIEKLETYSDEIIGVRVVVETPHRTHRTGNLHHVSVVVSIPGKDVVVNRDPGRHHAHEDRRVAIHDAFQAARRQLEDRVRITHRRVKTKEVQDHGRVVRLEAGQDFGVLETRTGREVYFHRNAVVDGRFDQLEFGTQVRFVEAPEPGEKGPQASTVHIEGRHHHVVAPE